MYFKKMEEKNAYSQFSSPMKKIEISQGFYV